MTGESRPPWAGPAARAVRSALQRAAAAPALAGLRPHVYELGSEGRGHHVLGLGVRLGSAHRRPGWSTHAFLELTDPDHPNLGLITVCDRSDVDGRPVADRRYPLLNTRLDERFVRRFITTARLALAELDPTGRSRSVAVIRNPGRTTFGDALAVPLWVALLLRHCAWRTQLALVIVDFGGFERTARTAVRLLGRHPLHLFPATSTPATTPMRLPATFPGRPPDGLLFSTATAAGLAAARRHLDRHRRAVEEPHAGR
ncbi:hypothetical protein WDV06_03260 [Streptomyces racemochromogenes]|uniref:Uncharacterized protein n=1 Tax=Streptomyces racemochromogenes TaxID=67353 RepID=A0ABW7P7T9_9ACTN